MRRKVVKHRIIYRDRPAWLVAEKKRDAHKRRAAGGDFDVPSNDLYPDDYAGKVLAVLPAEDPRSSDGYPETVLDLADDEYAELRNRRRKVDSSGRRTVPVTFDDRWGRVASTLRANIADVEAVEERAAACRRMEDEDIDVRRFNDLSGLAKGMLPKTETHTGTGYYACRGTGVTQNEDTINGAPAGQVITLTTGGLGTADAFKGGYVKPKTGILSGVDDQPTATGASAPAGHSWAASVSTGAAWVAADDNAATTWLGAWTGPEWWEYTPPTSKTYGKISIQAKTVMAWALPKDFKAQGWNGSSWIDLLTVTGETGWTAGEKRSWEFTSNIAAYSKYRLYITGIDGSSYIEIAEVEWFVITEDVRAIVSHTDDTVTLEGDISAWGDQDVIVIYDAFNLIQTALDQLWTDQGSAAFTASQVIRVFASTYDENVTPNAALNPDETNGFLLVIEGDPADSRDSIIIQPTSGTDSIYVNCDSAIVRHLTITGSVAVYGVRSYSGNLWLEVTDCVVVLTTAANSVGIYPRGRAYIADCDVSIQAQNGSSGGIFSYNATMLVRRCKVTGNGGDATGITGRMGHVVESCIVSGFLVGFGDAPVGPSTGPHQIRNCTVYNCTYGLWHSNLYHPTLDVVNTIFHTCTNVLTFHEAMPEWSGSDVIGDVARLLNCCFFNYTTFAKQWVGGGDKTYAEFIALNRVTALGNLDNVNPLLTDPGTGDFSLPKTSKAYKGGHGAGVVKGQNNTAFDKFHPDIGGWASGEITGTPSIGSISSSGLSVTVNVVAGGGSPAVRARLCLPNGTTVDEAQRTDTGAIVLAATESGLHAVEIWGVNQQQEALTGPSNAQIIYVSAAAVDTSPVNKLFDAVFYLLKNTAAITAVVPEANIRPNEDPSEALAGNAIYYLWAGGKWDLKRKRGVGTIGLTVAAVKNHQEADELMDLVRETLTAKALTYAGSPVRVHLFAEDEAFVDTGTTASGRFEAATQFSVKFVEAS